MGCCVALFVCLELRLVTDERTDRQTDDIRAATAGLPPPQVTSGEASSSLALFEPFTEAKVRRIITTSPVKSRSLDPVPSFLRREYVDMVPPYVTRMVNASLAQGRLTVSQWYETGSGRRRYIKPLTSVQPQLRVKSR